MSYDQEIEKIYHPENFEKNFDQENEDEEKAEQHAIKNDARKKLFKEIYGAMIDVKYLDLNERDVAEICEGVLKLYKLKFLVAPKIKN